MKKRMLLIGLLAASPMFVQAADININLGNAKIQSGNTTITFGDRDNRGYYWDGKVWRDPRYWEEHHGKGKRGNSSDDQGKRHCPPGQAKKGNC